MSRRFINCSANMARGVDKALLVFIVLASFLPPVTDLKYVVQSHHVFLRNLVLQNFRCIWLLVYSIPHHSCFAN